MMSCTESNRFVSSCSFNRSCAQVVISFYKTCVIHEYMGVSAGYVFVRGRKSLSQESGTYASTI